MVDADGANVVSIWEDIQFECTAKFWPVYDKFSLAISFKADLKKPTMNFTYVSERLRSPIFTMLLVFLVACNLDAAVATAATVDTAVFERKRHRALRCWPSLHAATRRHSLDVSARNLLIMKKYLLRFRKLR